MKKIKDSEEKSACSFRPRVNKERPTSRNSLMESNKISSQYQKLSTEQNRFEALYSLAKIEREEKEKNTRTKEDLEIEENMKECTFAP